MRQIFRKLFSPILKPFEQGDGPYAYKALNRKILVAIGVLFGFLAAAVFIVAPRGQGMSFLIPVLVFGSVASVSLIVAFLGTDRAVARIWGNK